MSPAEAAAIVEGLVSILEPDKARVAAASIVEALDMATYGDASGVLLDAMANDLGLAPEAAEIRRQYATPTQGETP